MIANFIKSKTVRILSISFFILISPVICAKTQPIEKFLTLSDIHFNPFASCALLKLHACPLIQKLSQADAKDWEKIFAKEPYQEMARVFHETNFVLLKSALAQIKLVNLQENPRFILFLGDSLAHNYRAQYILYSRDRTKAGFERFVSKTLAYLTLAIREAIPNKDIYPAVGNNDSYTGNYKVDPNGQFLNDTRKTWSVFILNKHNKESFLQTFPIGGYYSVETPNNANQRIIVLNTVLFSPNNQTAKVKQAAEAQLTWLHQQLTEAKQHHQKILLAFHIPIGVDVYRTIKIWFTGIKEFWLPKYSVAFREELQQFPNIVTGILPGHIHMDSFQIFVFNQVEKIPVSFTPSISPIYGNNPSFKVYSYDANTFQLQNFETYFYPLEAHKTWQKEYNFNLLYQSHCVDCGISTGIQSLQTSKELINFYKKYYAVSNDAQPITEDKDWLAYYACGITSLSSQDFEKCIHPK